MIVGGKPVTDIDEEPSAEDIEKQPPQPGSADARGSGGTRGSGDTRSSGDTRGSGDTR
jgi:hypothetical protein